MNKGLMMSAVLAAAMDPHFFDAPRQESADAIEVRMRMREQVSESLRLAREAKAAAKRERKAKRNLSQWSKP